MGFIVLAERDRTGEVTTLEQSTLRDLATELVIDLVVVVLVGDTERNGLAVIIDAIGDGAADIVEVAELDTGLNWLERHGVFLWLC